MPEILAAHRRSHCATRHCLADGLPVASRVSHGPKGGHHEDARGPGRLWSARPDVGRLPVPAVTVVAEAMTVFWGKEVLVSPLEGDQRYCLPSGFLVASLS